MQTNCETFSINKLDSIDELNKNISQVNEKLNKPQP